MRKNLSVAVLVAMIAAFALLFSTPGCRAQGASDGSSATKSQARSLADIARGVGLDVGTGPRNGAALQAEPPAAAAFREGGGGIEDLAGQAAASAPKSTAELDTWSMLTDSLSLFTHKPYVLDLMLGFILSILMSLLLTSWPKSLVARDPVAAVEERNGGVILALVGCLAAELVQSSEQLMMGAEIALVLFGIGGLIRFRTVFGDPRRTGLMILITILGLCCGMSQYALAVLGFVVIWFVRYFLLSKITLVVQVRPRKNSDMEQVRAAATNIVVHRGVTIRSSTVVRGGRVLELHASARGAMDEAELSQALEGALPGARVRVTAS